jgi:hypothetical protein
MECKGDAGRESSVAMSINASVGACLAAPSRTGSERPSLGLRRNKFGLSVAGFFPFQESWCSQTLRSQKSKPLSKLLVVSNFSIEFVSQHTAG